MYHLFIHYLKSDGDIERVIYTVNKSQVMAILNDYKNKRTFSVEPIDEEIAGVIASYPSDRVAFIEAIPVEKSPITRAREERARQLAAQAAQEQSAEEAQADAVAKLLAAKAESEATSGETVG